VAAAVLGGVALDARGDYAATSIQRDAARARDRYDRAGTLALGLAATAAVTAAVGLWLWGHDR
jgi:hypothetical protein